MKCFLNRSCKIHITIDKVNLFYTAKKVTHVSDQIICFTDKNDKDFCFNTKYVHEIHEIY